MPSFDARTVVLVAFLLNGLFCVILFALNRSMGHRLPGLRHGSWAAMVWAIGAGLVMERGAIPNVLSVLLGNIAISGGILLMHSAIHISVIGPLRRPAWPLFIAVASSFTMVCIFFLGSYSSFLGFATGYNATLFLACLCVAWRARPLGLAMGFTALVLAVGMVASAIRFLVTTITNDVVTQAFDPSSFQRAYFSAIALSIPSILLGFTLITYERLSKMLFTANSFLESEVAARTADLRLEIERKQVLERLVASTAEAERRRIGSELHDDLGQRLTGISLVAEILSRELGKTAQSLSNHADAIQRAASDAIAQVRGLARGLMPVAPEPEGFSEALALLANASSVQGLSCKFEYDEPVDIKNQDVATNLFRIAQEAVSNAIHHAKAQSITMRLDVINGKVVFSVADDGLGFEWPRAPGDVDRGRGLGIMEFRASLIQYRLNIETSPGKGSTIKVMEC